MNRLLACAVIVLFAASGCFWPFSKGRQPVSPPAIDDGISVEILNVPSMQKVRKIYFEPLSAGSDAEAGDMLDRLALMIIRGFFDALGDGSRFILVPADDAAKADVVIKGRFEEFKVRGHLKRKVSMKIRADVRSASDDEVLALIYAQREFRDKKKNSDEAAYNMGYVVAQKLSE
jgi:hypothetical protein